MAEGKGSDFVVLCEFSEKDGPVPRELLGSPHVGFPLDQFAVRLMSVELKIEVGDKWSVWSQWRAQGVECLVVHFQLHDLDARGYSRQLVFAYVTYSPKKLLKHRSIYLGALNQAADMMMEANEQDWRYQLTSRLSDLRTVYLYIKRDQIEKKKERAQREQTRSEQSGPDASNQTAPTPSSRTENTRTSVKNKLVKKEKISKPSLILEFESKEDLPFPDPGILESSYMELLRLQEKTYANSDWDSQRVATEQAESRFDQSQPSLARQGSGYASTGDFDAFYNERIQRNEEEDVLGQSKSKLSSRISSRPQKPSNHLRELYLGMWGKSERTGLVLKPTLKREATSFVRPPDSASATSVLLSDTIRPSVSLPLLDRQGGSATSLSSTPPSATFIPTPTHAQLSQVYCLHYKNSLYDKSLRPIWALCPPALTRSLSLLRGLLDGFSHDTVVLDHIRQEHKLLLTSPSALLAIGEVPIINFDLEALTSETPSPASLRWLSQQQLTQYLTKQSQGTHSTSASYGPPVARGPQETDLDFSSNAPVGATSPLSTTFSAGSTSFSSIPHFFDAISNASSDIHSPVMPSSPHSTTSSVDRHLYHDQSPYHLDSSRTAHVLLDATSPRTHKNSDAKSPSSPSGHDDPILLLSPPSNADGPLSGHAYGHKKPLASTNELGASLDATPQLPIFAAQHPLAVLASSVTHSLIGDSALTKHSAANSPPSCHSYLAPGAPLISDLALHMSDIHVAHRLDYLASQLTSISSLLWPSSTCPSAYFPPGASAKSPSSPHNTISHSNPDPERPVPPLQKTSSGEPLVVVGPHGNSTLSMSWNITTHHTLIPAQPSPAALAVLGLGRAANEAAVASGALPPELVSSYAPMSSSGITQQRGTPVIKVVQEEPSSSRRPNPAARALPAPALLPPSINTFTSCVACQHSAVDSFLVQLHHDAISVKSGEDEASSVWRVKYQQRTCIQLNHSTTSINSELIEETSSDSGIGRPRHQLTSLPSDPTTTTAPFASGENNTNDNRNVSATSTMGAATAILNSIQPQPSQPQPQPIHPPKQGPSTYNSSSTPSSPAPQTPHASSKSGSGTPGGRRGAATPTSQSSSTSSQPQPPISAMALLPVSEMNLLHLRNRFSFLRHVIFSLLKGRPVIIHAEARHRPWVEQVVASLSCFVPGHHLTGDSITEAISKVDRHGRSKTISSSSNNRFIRVIGWRDARDVIYEAIHSQNISSSSTKSRIKHTKLVLSMFLQQHLQKMKWYSESGKGSTTPEQGPNQNLKRENQPSSHPHSSSNSSSNNANTSIPTLGTASRQALKLAHLSGIKLMGLDKSCPVPKSVERYVTYWDWEAEELTCVPYEKGRFLDAMINPKKQWPDEASYRAYLHFHLSDLALRAWLFYHMCCVGLASSGQVAMNAAALKQRQQQYLMQQQQQSASYHRDPRQQQLQNQQFQKASGQMPQSPYKHPLSSSSSSIGSGFNDSPTYGSVPSSPRGGASNLVPAAPPSSRHVHLSEDLGFAPAKGMLQSAARGGPSQSTATTSTLTPTVTTPAPMSSVGPSLIGPSLVGPSLSSLDAPPPPPPSTPTKDHHEIPSSPFSLHLAQSAATVSRQGVTPLPSSSVHSHNSSNIRTNPSTPQTNKFAPRQAPPASSSFAPGSNVPLVSATTPGVGTNPSPADYAFQAHQTHLRTKSAYFASLKLLENDAEIIEYLAEVIKSQQSEEIKTLIPAVDSFFTLQLFDLLSATSDHAATSSDSQSSHTAKDPIPLRSPSASTVRLDIAPTRKLKNMAIS